MVFGGDGRFWDSYLRATVYPAFKVLLNPTFYAHLLAFQRGVIAEEKIALSLVRCKEAAVQF